MRVSLEQLLFAAFAWAVTQLRMLTGRKRPEAMAEVTPALTLVAFGQWDPQQVLFAALDSLDVAGCLALPGDTPCAVEPLASRCRRLVCAGGLSGAAYVAAVVRGADGALAFQQLHRVQVGVQ